MRAQRSGTVVNSSSMAGFFAGPALAPYSMSKFAVEAVTESLHGELNAFNIRVLLVEPGACRTNFVGALKTPAAGMTGDCQEVLDSSR